MKKDYILKYPITFEGEKITKLDFDFVTQKGNVLLEVEELYIHRNPMRGTNMAELTKEFQLLFAAKIAKCPHELILSLSVPDTLAVSHIMQAFLLAGEIPEVME